MTLERPNVLRCDFNVLKLQCPVKLDLFLFFFLNSVPKNFMKCVVGVRVCVHACCWRHLVTLQFRLSCSGTVLFICKTRMNYLTNTAYKIDIPERGDLRFQQVDRQE